MLKFFIFALFLFSINVHAQGMEGSPVSTPDTRADASRRSAEIWKEIERQNEIARKEATRDLIRERLFAQHEMSKSRGHFEFKKPYPIFVYDPNQGTKTTKQGSLISRIEVPASVKRSVKGLTRGLGANVLALAIYELLGKGVGWLLDVDNHRVIYFPDSINPNDSGKWCLYSYNQGSCVSEGTYDQMLYSDAWGFKRGVHTVKLIESGVLTSYDRRANGKYYLTFDVQIDKRTIVNLDPAEAELSLEVIAQKIHEMAEERDNQAAKDFLQKLAEEAIKAGEFDDEIAKNIVDDNQLLDDIEALNNPQPTPTTTTTKDEEEAKLADEKEKDEDKITTGTTGGSFEFPQFCTWAKVVCDFIKDEELDLEPEQVPETEVRLKNPEDFDQRHVNIGGSCPADIVRSFNTGFATNEIRFEMQPICNHASTYVRPVIIFLASLWAVIHISGAFRVS